MLHGHEAIVGFFGELQHQAFTRLAPAFRGAGNGDQFGRIDIRLIQSDLIVSLSPRGWQGGAAIGRRSAMSGKILELSGLRRFQWDVGWHL